MHSRDRDVKASGVHGDELEKLWEKEDACVLIVVR
jgi:hypothetical protein